MNTKNQRAYQVIKRELPVSFYDKSRYAYASTYAYGWDET
jgi:hypothetical protein